MLKTVVNLRTRNKHSLPKSEIRNFKIKFEFSFTFSESLDFRKKIKFFSIFHSSKHNIGLQNTFPTYSQKTILKIENTTLII